MEIDNATVSWPFLRYPVWTSRYGVNPAAGRLFAKKNQVVLPRSRLVLGMPVVFRGCVPSLGYTKSIQPRARIPAGRASRGRGVLLPSPPGTLNPRGLASSRAVLQLSKAPGRVLSVIITIMINYY